MTEEREMIQLKNTIYELEQRIEKLEQELDYRIEAKINEGYSKLYRQFKF